MRKNAPVRNPPSRTESGRDREGSPFASSRTLSPSSKEVSASSEAKERCAGRAGGRETARRDQEEKKNKQNPKTETYASKEAASLPSLFSHPCEEPCRFPALPLFVAARFKKQVACGDPPPPLFTFYPTARPPRPSETDWIDSERSEAMRGVASGSRFFVTRSDSLVASARAGRVSQNIPTEKETKPRGGGGKGGEDSISVNPRKPPDRRAYNSPSFKSRGCLVSSPPFSIFTGKIFSVA